MLITKEDSYHIHLFDTVGEIADQSVSMRSMSDRTTSCFMNHDWTGFKLGKSWDDFQRAVDSPWEEGLRIIEGMIDEMRSERLPEPKTRKRRQRWNEDDGDEFDKERMQTGKPFWLSSVRQETHGPTTLTIVIDTYAYSYRDSEEIMWRGAAALCLATILEDVGYRTEIITGTAFSRPYRYGSDNCFCGCIIKRHEDTFDLSSLAVGISGWFFRLGYVPVQQCGNKECDSGYGGHGRMRPLLHHLTNDQNPMLVEDIWSRKAAVQWVKTQIESLNTRLVT
jgi:hypothetical protein